MAEYWEKNRVYEHVRRVCWEEREGRPIFAFLEGPPTANGFMHVGHARGRTFKDIKLRFYRMMGFRVWDQGGWDTQGLPVELEVEKKLGFKTKKDVEKYGVERFVEECSRLVDFYIDRWTRDNLRLAVWLDYRHAYQTRHPRYIETVWGFIKKMWEDGLLYEDLRVVPRCPRCETALSQHEVAQGYEEVDDPSLYFKIPLLDKPDTYLIAWTTTPWTIIANEAAAVHPEEEYVVLSVDGEKWILAARRLEEFVRDVGLEGYRVVGRLKGSELEGLRYRHPLLEEVPYHASHDAPNHTVIAEDWVTMEEGTGVVHAAPAHGPEDFEAAKRRGLLIYTPLRIDGYFSEEAGAFAGLWFEDASRKVVEALKDKGLLVHLGVYRHNYPFCWRCGTRLFYYASRQWFIKITEDGRRLLLREAEAADWRPSWAVRRMTGWLENAKDWCISRERYWGTPLPVWRCRSCGAVVVVGSFEELRRLAVNPEEFRDPHRPWIDRVVLRCPRCGGEMRREPFVVDVWMDSGVAHTAALRQYGWEKLFEKLYPYNWITEAADQTRGWFYTLLVTGSFWHGRCPYRAVLLQGHVLDEQGRKMSKSKGNVIWAGDALRKYGADPLRLFLVSRAPWDSIVFDPKEIARYRGVIDTLWNVARFAASYMELDKWRPKGIDSADLAPEDKWIIAELAGLVKTLAEGIEADNYHQALRALVDFIVEKLSHRYVTVIRPRVWVEEETESKRAAYETLFYVIDNTIRVLAVFAPYVAEFLYQSFVKHYRGGGLTVHVEEWPRVPERLVDERMRRLVDSIFEAAEEVLRIRMEKGVKRRWPLPEAVLVPKNGYSVEEVAEASNVLKIYANIKRVSASPEPPRDRERYTVIEGDAVDAYVVTELDEETILEGLARDIVRRIQVMRKRAGLPLDKFLERVVIYTPSQRLRRAVEKHVDYIAGEIRAKEIQLVDKPPKDAKKWRVEGEDVYIALVF